MTTDLQMCRQELEGVWRELMTALVKDDKPMVAERALLYAYYW